MSKKRILVLLGILGAVAVLLAACAGEPGEPGPEGPPGPAGEQGPPGAPLTIADLTCAECHNDTTVLYQAQQQWEESLHATGTSAAYAGARTGCTACHSSEGFSAMVAAGVGPNDLEEAPLVPTNQNCRTCHQIHTTYTEADFALATDDALTLYASGVDFDGGEGNLCSNCHQPRRGIAEADADGNIEVTSTHWGPHHGPQSAMLMGVGGASAEDGSPSAHATMVEDTCVSCHMGAGNDHSMEPDIAACTGCHADAEDFDLNGVMTEVDALIEELHELLEAKGLYHDGHPVVGSYAEAEAWALWNYIFIAVEDGSHGVHNSKYTIALLEASIEALK